jgi:hypothetical protein
MTDSALRREHPTPQLQPFPVSPPLATISCRETARTPLSKFGDPTSRQLANPIPISHFHLSDSIRNPLQKCHALALPTSLPDRINEKKLVIVAKYLPFRSEIFGPAKMIDLPAASQFGKSTS